MGAGIQVIEYQNCSDQATSGLKLADQPVAVAPESFSAAA